MIRKSFASAMFVVMAILMTAVPVNAAVVTNQSCYAVSGLEEPPNYYDNLAWIVVDETTPLDVNLRHAVLENVEGLVQPGTTVVVAKFSAFAEGRYTQVVFKARIDRPYNDANSWTTGQRALKAYQECLTAQRRDVAYQAELVVNQIMQGATSALARSDIMQAMKEISAPIAADRIARHKTVLLVSDTLENSTTTFYVKGKIRLIDPELEIKRAHQADLVGNFGDGVKTQVYVIGAATLDPPSPTKASSHSAQAKPADSRSPPVLHALEAFWTHYFQDAHAVLAGYGVPELLINASFK